MRYLKLVSESPFRLSRQRSVSPLEGMQEVRHAVPEVYIRDMESAAHDAQDGVRALSLQKTEKKERREDEEMEGM